MYNEILKALENRQNVFLTGGGGTGKSYLLNKLCQSLEITVTSTTGISAMSIGGQTIHSWAGIGIGSRPVETMVSHIKNRRLSVLQAIQNCEILAIDEISMLDGKLFDYLDEVLRRLRYSTKPFGGITILAIGDFFQLPPVNDENGFAFESKAWGECKFTNIVLTEVKRQKDLNFITALNNARVGKLTEQDVEIFKSREIELDDSPENQVLHIFGKNSQADQYNTQKLNELTTDLYTFHASEEGFPDDLAKLDKDCRAPKELNLKVGCRVMLVKNLDFSSGLVNGSCGTVKHISDMPKYISVEFDNGYETCITPEDFEIEKDNKVIAKRKQLPLRLAYGITIHKSQGMTLDTVRVNLKNIFSAGQAYVALSRARTLEGLYLAGFNPEKIYADSKIIKFYENLKDPEPEIVVDQKKLFDVNVGSDNTPLYVKATKQVTTVFDILNREKREVEKLAGIKSVYQEPRGYGAKGSFMGIDDEPAPAPKAKYVKPDEPVVAYNAYYNEEKTFRTESEAREEGFVDIKQEIPRYSFTQETGFVPANEAAKKDYAVRFDEYDKNGRYQGDDLIGVDEIPF